MSTIGLNVWAKVKCGAKKLIVYANGECVANGFMCSGSVGWKPDWSLGWKPVGHMAGGLIFFSKEQKTQLDASCQFCPLSLSGAVTTSTAGWRVVLLVPYQLCFRRIGLSFASAAFSVS